MNIQIKAVYDASLDCRHRWCSRKLEAFWYGIFIVIQWSVRSYFIESQWNMPYPVWKCPTYETAQSLYYWELSASYYKKGYKTRKSIHQTNLFNICPAYQIKLKRPTFIFIYFQMVSWRLIISYIKVNRLQRNPPIIKMLLPSNSRGLTFQVSISRIIVTFHQK